MLIEPKRADRACLTRWLCDKSQWFSSKLSMHRISFLTTTIRTRPRLMSDDSHVDLSLSPAKMAQRAETTQRQFFTQNQPCSPSGRKQYKQATYAASTPNVCIAPCLRDQGIWKYATLKPATHDSQLTKQTTSIYLPPSVRARLIKALTSPYHTPHPQNPFKRTDRNRHTYLMFWEHITTIRINRNRIDHDRKFRNTPSKHQSDGAQVVLEGRA